MISSRYREMNQRMHLTRARYGTTGIQHAELIKGVIGKVSAQTLLDYGCGKQTLKGALAGLVEYRAYDPAIPELSALPYSADVVACTDVMEHVEPEYVDAVLAHIKALTRKAAVFSICCEDGVRLFSDGSNTHRSVHSADWWGVKLVEIGTLDIRQADGKDLVCVVWL